MDKCGTSHWCFPNTNTFDALQAGCAWLDLEASKPEEAQKPEETCWVIVCWLMRCAAACQFLYFRNSRQRLIKIGELGKDWGQPGARLTKMNYIELRYYTTEWCCINTAGCFGLQFDPCSLIPRNRLFSPMALCSRFVYWIICLYTCPQWSTMCFVSPLLYWLQLPLSPSGQPIDNFHQYAVCSQFFPSEVDQGNATRDGSLGCSVWWYVIQFYSGHTQCTSLHRFTHVYTPDFLFHP